MQQVQTSLIAPTTPISPTQQTGASAVYPAALSSWESFSQALFGHRPSLPEFHGQDYEDPGKYLQRCLEYLHSLLTPEGEQVRTLEKGLKGEAEKWWHCYRSMSIGFEQYAELIRNRFDNPRVRNDLLAKLYGKKQGDREAVGSFLQQKYQLFNRLRPSEPESDRLDAMVNLLRPSIRRNLRAHQLYDFSDLLNKALACERDDEEEVEHKPKPRRESEDKKGVPDRPRELPQCWFCPGRHYNRDCPTRQTPNHAAAPMGNWREPERPGPNPGSLNHIHTPSANLLRVSAELDGEEICAAIDSAATSNFVLSDYLPSGAEVEKGSYPVELAAKGKTMVVTGEVWLKLKLQGEFFKLKALVSPDLREKLILGLNWLKEEKAVIDLIRGSLMIGRDRRISTSFLGLPPATVEYPLPGLELQLKQDFPPAYLEDFLKLARTYAQTLTPRMGPLSQTLTTRHDIKLISSKPFRLALYHYSDEKKVEIERQVQEMLAEGIVEHSISPYNSPIVLAKRKDDKWRFCVDYRRLNSITEDSTQTIPRIADALKDIAEATVFSTIDLKSGYWQIRMEDRAKPYTAFSTPSGGSYQFKVMPFGLKGAPGTFTRLMSQEVLVGFINKFCIVYLDDILIFSGDWEEHLYHLSLVLERLSYHGLTCSPEKCRFGMTSLDFLGFTITPTGNQVRPEYVQGIIKAAVPSTKRQLQSFIGACNWLHEFIPHLATIMAPLTDILRGNRSFKWTKEAQSSFEATKEAFNRPLKLARPIPQARYILQTDASSRGMGVLLYQEPNPGQKNIIAYSSAKFNNAESRYHCNEQECLSVIYGIKKFRHYLEDKPFTLRTDSRSLTWLNRFKDTRDKLARWAMLLQEFSFDVEHCPGKQNEFADLLSRNPVEEQHHALADQDRMLLPDISVQTPTGSSPAEVLYSIGEPLMIQEITASQQMDQRITKLAQECTDVGERAERATARELLLLQRNKVSKEGILWQRTSDDGEWKLAVPESLKELVLSEYHDGAGHPGSDETYRSIQTRFHWPNMQQDIRQYVQICRLCACAKSSLGGKGGLRPHQPTKCWKTLAVDLMGPYPRTSRGKKFILVVTDLFSRWIEAFALASSTTDVIVRSMENDLFFRWGYAKEILSDNGPQFGSDLWREACQRWGMTPWTTAIYHPQANVTERRNQEIKKGLRLHLHGKRHTEWDLQLPRILFHLRTRRNAATGVTPAQVMIGRELMRPGDWELDSMRPQDKPNDEIIAHQRHYQQRYARPTHQQYKEGQMVYIKAHHLSNAAAKFSAGLALKWEGPYPILRRVSDAIYIIDRRGVEAKVHISEIKVAHQSERQRQVISEVVGEDPSLQPTGAEGLQPVTRHVQEEGQDLPSELDETTSNNPVEGENKPTNEDRPTTREVGQEEIHRRRGRPKGSTGVSRAHSADPPPIRHHYNLRSRK